MFKWISNLVDSNEREIARLKPAVAEINALEPELQAMSDQQLREHVARAREEVLQDEGALDKVLPRVFAAVREAAWRSIHQRHYDVQLMGGMVLHSGKI